MMKTIPKEKLTKQYLQSYADAQIEAYLSVGPVDEEKAEQHIMKAYVVAGLKTPTKFEWFDSPYVWDSVRASVWDSVGASVRASVRDSVWASVRASVGDSVWDSVRDSVGDSVWAWYDAPYNSWLKFFNDNLEKNDFEHICNFDEMVNGYYLTEDTVYIIRKPIFLARDEQGRLHNDSRMAIEWADGKGIYFLHGQEFGKELFDKIASQKMTIKDVMAIENADQRTMAISMLRPDRLLKHMGAKLVHTGQRGTKLYEVKNFMDTGDTEYCMHMQDSSTDRSFIEWVEPKVGKKHDADAAQAAAWGLSKEVYLSLGAEA